MDTLLKDIAYGIRGLVKRPGFAAIAVVTLALGIGANTAIFTVVNSVLLRPLPYKDPDRLMLIREMKLPEFPEFSVAPGNFLDWQKQNTVFERMIAIGGGSFNLVGDGEPERLRASNVTDGFLAILGVQPQLGRDFLPEEDKEGANHVVIISDRLWQRRFGGDRNIINRNLNLDGQSYTVVGVTPAGFYFGSREIDLWTPMGFTARQAQNHGGHYLAALGRLKPGVTVDQARSEMITIAARLAAQYPEDDTGWSVKMAPVLEFAVRSIRPALVVLLVAVSFVLLIACANVANLLLARGAGRQQEIAVRSALGASRGRLIRQLLTESLLLSLVGGLLGLLLAKGGVVLLQRLAPQSLPRINDISLDSKVLLFTIGITLLTSVVFGLAPALQASKPQFNEMMKDAGRGSTEGGRRQFIRSSLVVLEVAAALVLLVGSGLMIKSFWRLQKVDPGFTSDHALAASIALPEKKYAEDAKQVAFFQQLIERTRGLPGVQAVGVASTLPLDRDNVYGYAVQGRPPLPPGASQSANFYAVSADYFSAMGIPLVRGRVFTERDVKDSPHVTLINQTLAKKTFTGEDPIGKRITFDVGSANPDWFEIVGIVGDVKQYSLDQVTPAQLYEPHTQQTFSTMMLVARTAGDPTVLSSAIRNQVSQLDKDQPVSNIRTLDELLSTSVSPQRFSAVLLGVFASVALVLAVVGIYGVLSYAVQQRTREIGIRRALGAAPGDVIRLVVGHGMLVTLIGVGIGIAGAFALTRLLADLLFEVGVTDLATFSTVSVLLIVVALVACLAPALRALRVDPLVALRYE